MSFYARLILNHANLKRPVHIIAGTIGGYNWSEAGKCTNVYTIAGIFPTTETPEQIDELLNQLDNKGETNYANASNKHEQDLQGNGPQRQGAIPSKDRRRKR